MKKLLKRIMPDPRTILESRHLSVFGKRIHDANLWHLNRRSASGAVAVGFFVAYMPPFAHMLVAAALAIALRVNLPVTLAAVWLNNPLTLAPISYSAYAVGSLVMGVRPKGFDLDFWIDPHNWLGVLTPFLIGSLVCALLCAALGYFGVQALWRWTLRREIARRRQRYQQMRAQVIAAALVSAPVVSTPSSNRQT
ncbi:DUF2062 domain-containing protein [Candidatus Thiodictyon syntrophicum]|nr:DUF2062 domain-containing protein [Candidatus Thiodictyon syntrophicum]